MRGATSNLRIYFLYSLNFNPRSSCEERLQPSAADVPRRYFNPRSSCEERRDAIQYLVDKYHISIHAPHARSDRSISVGKSTLVDFNPRSSCEERQDGKFTCCSGIAISIHAPHARSDFMIMSLYGHAKFQSTLLMRGATQTRCQRVSKT